jgi:hypothetical protein
MQGMLEIIMIMGTHCHEKKHLHRSKTYLHDFRNDPRYVKIINDHSQIQHRLLKVTARSRLGTHQHTFGTQRWIFTRVFLSLWCKSLKYWFFVCFYIVGNGTSGYCVLMSEGRRHGSGSPDEIYVWFWPISVLLVLCFLLI